MIELSEQQQIEEDARLAKEILENPLFQRVFNDHEAEFTARLMSLEPQDQEAFPIIQAARKYIILIRNRFENIANAPKNTKEPGPIVA